MFNKILGWVWMVWNIVGFFYIDTYQDAWLFSLVFIIGNIYITAKYLESLK